MSGYKPTPDSIEKDRVNDILMTQKHLTEMYNTASTEVDCPSLHTDLLNILQEEHQMTRELYDAMRTRGWYDTPKAQQTEIDNTYNEFNKMKNELNI